MASFSRTEYEQYLYGLPETEAEIQSSSLRLFTVGRNVGNLKGSVWFRSGIELRVQEVVDLIDGEILDYSYTATSRVNAFAGMTRNLIPKTMNCGRHFHITATSRPTSSTIVAPRQASRFRRPICQH
ncbi:MAG: hypothetical protein R6W76_01560 [Caldilinea sp.]